MIWRHYHEHGRILPWRETSDPYAILVSEVMLQQTQTSRIEDAYYAFLEAFPTVFHLATAPLRDVLSLWQGLGYNRRAVNLHRAAGIIAAEHGGRVPDSYDELLKLPGIGPYTASAVCVFAFNQAMPVLDTNVRAVYIHVFFPCATSVHDRDLIPLMRETLDTSNPREWGYALMDFGAMLKKAHKNPSRRSAHYQRQGAFEGSHRQKRGAVIRRLLGSGPATAKQLASSCGMGEELAARVADELVDEGFLRRDGERYDIA
jgi:A/G-specific adenine glycosylase